MADIGGHLRIPNRLFEAIISAGFEKMQLQVVLAILRLSMGWQRGSVVASYADLAELVGATNSGGFRSQVKDLIANGVIVMMTQGTGAHSSAYGLQRDYTQWGRFAQAEAKLEAIWGKRPASDDQLPLRILTIEGGEGASTEAPPLPPQRHPPCLHRGTQGASTEAPPRESNAEGATPSEAGKTVEIQTTPQPPKRLGRGEALELLARIEGLKEHVGDREIIRLDRVRAEFGEDVAQALKTLGGTKRVLTTEPAYRGVLASDLADCLVLAQQQRKEAIA